ncbi:hypothetical protein QR680_005543 [Steinernema hermaphroditum]|uniref:IST1 homolog n=1 Tax=Steinernema hermaphroditum TaxID=289476 RepID=A0AA39LVK6_9BILA|nr:hypothetical protein QR680_005543 [Steinernema hermaphroditum]
MSITWGTQYSKLKTNLRVAINRLKLVQKKKTELALKARTEIADFITAHKEDRARIRVEHIIREDFLVEAYELLEMYCDLLLARFGLIQQMKNLDDGIAEAVISIMWAAPRVVTDIAEFKIISDQLTLKYGKPFAEAARANQLEYPAKVSTKLIQKLSVSAPAKILVERHGDFLHRKVLITAADVMREDEVAAAEQMLIDFRNQGNAHPNQEIGWMPDDNDTSNPGNFPPPPPPNFPNFYPGPPPSGGNGGGGIALPQIPTPTQNVPGPNVTHPNQQQPFNYPRLSQNFTDSDIKIPHNPQPGIPSAPPASLPPKVAPLDFPNLPEPPSNFPDEYETVGPAPPSNSNDGNQPGDDLDFDDLAKRFDMLKKRNN